MLTRNGSPLTWTVDNLPASLGSSQGSSTFSYGPDRARYQQTATYNGSTATTTYIGGLFEVVATATSTDYRHNIIADGQVIAVHTIDQSGNATTSYLHYDHLGSIDTITDDQGERYSEHERCAGKHKCRGRQGHSERSAGSGLRRVRPAARCHELGL